MPVRLSPRGLRPVAAVALASASLIASAALGSIFLSAALDAWTAIAASGPAGPADGILLLAGLAGTLLSLWLGLGFTLSALSALPGALGHLCRRLAGRVAPSAVRKVVAFILGTTLTAALIPGTAVAGGSHEALRPAVVTTAQQATRTMSGLAVAAPDASFRFVSDPQGGLNRTDAAPPPSWSPDPAAPQEPPVPRQRPVPPRMISSPQRTGSGSDSVVVLRGDTLWSIAAHHLGPDATAADIDAEWHRWLAANRGVIGDDANLILPGQLLRPPPSAGAGS